MYKISIPIMYTAKTYNRDRILADLKLAGAERVFLAVDPIEYKTPRQEEIFKNIAQEVKFFKDNGLEVGIWFWAFWISGDCPLTPVTGFSGKKSTMEKCPANPEFLDYMAENLKKVAATGTDIIMFDDDLRLGFFDSKYGCVCEHHLKLMEETLGEPVSAEGLFEKCFAGSKNKYRSAYLKAAGDSLKNYCKRMREAVDTVNPDVRMGACSCLSVWDADGVDSFTLAKILAGNTKPFVRLIGAPYWAAKFSWGNRLGNVIELERMERAWYEGNDIEVFSEGDAYPRPRYTTPASYLEIFDTALHADGSFDGILKYMFDYTSNTEYERGYLEQHLENAELYKEIDKVFDGKECAGVRIYESLNKLEDADFTGMKVTEDYIQDTFFSHAGRFLSENTVPSVYKGSGVCGICFGENAINIPDTAFEKPLILDLAAAKILTAKGIDVGITEFNGLTKANVEIICENGDHVALNGSGIAFAGDIAVNEKVCIKSRYESGLPMFFTYKNGKGQIFFVYNFIARIIPENVRRTYYRAKQIVSSLKEYGISFPAACYENPDLYMMFKTGEKEDAIGLWNCFADRCKDVVITLEKSYKSASFINGEGELSGNVLKIKRIGAFEFCFINIK